MMGKIVCDGCGAEYKSDELDDIPVSSTLERMDEGGPFPSGECPVCHCFCYDEKLVREHAARNIGYVYVVTRIDDLGDPTDTVIGVWSDMALILRALAAREDFPSELLVETNSSIVWGYNGDERYPVAYITRCTVQTGG